MATLSNAIKSFDPGSEKKKEVELALNLAFDLAQAKCEQFKHEITEDLRTAGTSENPTIPISNILFSRYDTRAYVVDDVKKIVNEAQSAIGKFIAGGKKNILDGIGALLGTAVEALLGSGRGEQDGYEDYFIALEGYAIVRLDIKYWYRKIEIRGISKKIDCIMAFTAVKSSVDVNKITLNTFLQAYNTQLQKSNLSQGELKQAILLAKEIYHTLRDENIVINQAISDFIMPARGLFCD